MLNPSFPSFTIPGRYLCSITGQIMVEPVITADGHTYEREAIEVWLRENDTSPKTGQVLKHKDLTPNWDKISDVSEFLAENSVLKGSAELYLPKAWIGSLVLDLKANRASEVMEWFSKDRRLLTLPLEGAYTAFHLAAEFGSPELLERVYGQLEAQGSLEGIALRGALMARAADAISSHSQTPTESFEIPLKSSEGAGPSHSSLPEAIESRKTAEPSLKNQEIPAAQAQFHQAFKGRHLNTLLERALEQEDWLKSAQWLRLGAELEQPDLEFSDSLLARCVCRGQFSAVQWLLEQGASLSSCNFEGNTALHLSVLHYRLEVATFLLERQADLKVQNAQGQSALYLAIVGQSTPMMTAFVGAEQAALSPYHVALLQEDDLRLMKALLDQGAPGIDAFDAQGHSPLWIASQRGDVELVRALLEKGAKLELACGVEGQRALHIAAKQGHQEVVALLVASKAELEATDLKGNTALHYAIQTGSEAICLCLLEAGAYHKAKNHQNQTPIDLAHQSHHLQLATFIAKKIRALKQAKLEAISALHTITEEQTTRIKQLEAALAKQSTQHAQEKLMLQQQIVSQKEQIVSLKGIVEQHWEIQAKQSTQHAQEKLMLQQQIVSQKEQIVSLKRTVGQHWEIQEQRLTRLDKAVAELQPKVLPAPLVFSTSPTLKLVPAVRVGVTPSELPQFLRLIAEGEQVRVEAMLQEKRELALFSGNVTDLSGRTFENITGFQYAVWALDSHMWTMLRRYLPEDVAAEQLRTTGSWVRTHGLHAGMAEGPLDKLSIALKTYIDNFNAWCRDNGTKTIEQHWCKEVGGAQLLLPAHAINEYCRPDRSFYPCPNFEEPTLPRTRTVDEGEWFTAVYNGGKLGEKFGICRGRWAGAFAMGRGDKSMAGRVEDHAAVVSLTKVRTQQRGELASELNKYQQHTTLPKIGMK